MITNMLSKFSLRPAFRRFSQYSLGNKSIVPNSTNFKTQTIEVVSCGETFKEWRKHNKRYFIPKEPLKFLVEYIDTDVDLNTKSEYCVLALHGMPGTFSIYSQLLDTLSQQGIRVIAPNFPDSNYYPCSPSNEPGLFHQTGQEKEELLRDFLKALNVDKLDMLITHSSAIYPGIGLVLNQENLTINSLAALNMTSNIPVKSMKPLWLTKACAYMSSYLYTYKFLMKIGLFVINSFPTPFKSNDAHGMAMMAMTMIYTDIYKLKEQLQEVGRRKFPLLYIMGGKDIIVEKELAFKNVKLLGCSEDDIHFVDKEGECLQPPEQKNSWIKILNFNQGGHYLFRRCAESLHKEILSFFQKISK